MWAVLNEDRSCTVAACGFESPLELARSHHRKALNPEAPIGPPMNETQPEPIVDLIVPTAALVNAIGQLAIHYPLVFHADAWRTLTAELARREIAHASDQPIVLSRQHYDALPFDVNVALRGTKP
jgi:hypothetical protein